MVRRKRRRKGGKRSEVIYRVGGKRVGDAIAMVRAIQGGVEEGIEDWLEDIIIELNQNTGQIWPYLTGASTQGFSVEKEGEGAWSFENVEGYAIFLEARGGYLVELLDSRDQRLEESIQTEMDEL